MFEYSDSEIILIQKNPIMIKAFSGAYDVTFLLYQ
jgi:hypothetical protein